MDDYSQIALEARKKVLTLIYEAQTSHLGSNFSCIDILATLFEQIDLDQDIFVLSKGWAAASLYYFLWKKGRITIDELNSYCKSGSKFIGLAEPVIPEIKIAGGSMGLGFPGAVGLAMAKKMKREKGTVYCLMSDGEMQIGTTWESAMIAAHYGLDNLVVIVDFNKLQAMGTTKDVLDLFPLTPKWLAFNWHPIPIDGHHYPSIDVALRTDSFGKPKVIIADTIKGKGVPFMEGDNIWHYKAPEKEEYELAMKCLQS